MFFNRIPLNRNFKRLASGFGFVGLVAIKFKVKINFLENTVEILLKALLK